MSYWIKIEDKEGVELSEDGTSLDVLIGSDSFGNNYIEIPLEFIKRLFVNHNTELSELLAVIHADGGHYEGEHGTKKAVDDAEKKYYDMITEIEDLKKELTEKDILLDQKISKLGAIRALIEM